MNLITLSAAICADKASDGSAMLLRFRGGDESLPLNEERLFRHINAFHAKAYRKG